MTGAVQYEEYLRRLAGAAGEPSGQSLSGRVEAPARTIDAWLGCRVVPRWSHRVQQFLQELESLAGERPLSRSEWEGLLEDARRRLQGRRRVPEETARTGVQRDWLRAAEGSQAWKRVAPEWADQAGALRDHTLEVVNGLAELLDTKGEMLLRDPWYDPYLPVRTLVRADRPLERIKLRLDGTLAPAEAALIVLLPFLYQVRLAWTVDQLHHVDPTDLDDRVRPGDTERSGYAAVLRDHKQLIRQARRGDSLPDRSDGRQEAGWWLFHQWVRPQTRQPGRLDDVLDALGVVADVMRPVLAPSLLGRLLSCAHRRPRELFGTKQEEALDVNSFEVRFPGQDTQEVRERLVGPLFAIAHAMAVEATELPSVVVKHVGIPQPVDPERLLRTLKEADWRSVEDTVALSADCEHPAVVAALTEHTRHVDALLRETHRARPAVPEFAALPVYAHADGVREVDDRGAPRQTGEVIRFRLDEERVQELLMGENLYRDRSLAIRELYQNALDACRYRRAIEYQHNGGDTFPGKITFEQGRDDDGRYYLECRDNGIGMDETVLAEVFSRAGVRFSDHARSRKERTPAGDDGIKVRPNSRFGIGVLSYFMLADEIRVTTRHMPMDGVQSAELTVLITGPGHYFRVSRTEPQSGEIGTRVRLYLREDNAPSCVRELRRLLGIAEFHTEAFHGKSLKAAWKPGALETRQATGERAAGIVAHGRTVSWPPEGDVRCVDGQVVWCEQGGGILADGILIEPRVRHGVLAGPGQDGRLRGAVVNLAGGTRPKDLSVDRSEILDQDVDQVVEKLVTQALPALLAADPPLLTSDWLADVAVSSPRLADIVTEAAGKEGVLLEANGHATPVATVGFFPPDVDLVHRVPRTAYWADYVRGAGRRPDAVTLLWRLLAHRPNPELTALTGIVPELARITDVLPARPSDLLLRSYDSAGSRAWITHDDLEGSASPAHAVSAAMACGASYDEVLARMELLRLPVPERSGAKVAADSTTVTLLDKELRGPQGDFDAYRWLSTADHVPPGHIVKAHLMLNIRIEDVVGRLRTLGFPVPETGMRAETPEDWVPLLLSEDLDGEFPWLQPHQRVVAGRVLDAVRRLRRPLGEIVERLTDYGLRPEVGALDERSAREVLRLSAEWGWNDKVLRRLDVHEPVPPGPLVMACRRSGTALADVARRMEELGFCVGSLPDRVEDADAPLLDFANGREVPLEALVDRAADSGLSLAAAAARMRAYGLCPQDAVLPDHMAADDAKVLIDVARSLQRGGGSLTSSIVPMLTVLQTAERNRLSPQAVIDCLHRYGVRTSHATAPTRPGRHDSELVGVGLGIDHVSWDRPVPPFHLVTVAPALLMERDAVIGRLVEFGLQVPTQALDELTDEDLDLCRDGFGRDRTELPLRLGDPIDDYLTIARESGVPLEELLPSLTRLGVDLPKVAAAVRAALPYVPGLVMAPGDDAPQTAPTTSRPSPAT
ncbi:wHTH domain-containing protein [Streptomyces broussonetiae]|uniref:ATP-binding protein n=1 Tax=Streptomyces broussonetiae TaxID=2686304 RepID=A0A6I6N671_9ACTN|nr:ATP-binding protein [Streptomyces broussonetiae]QHA06149.1 hypothetical protein GQF42_25250 [Streptomyces broussonetiae]